jgi:transcriptional regulator with XRE-family HTH domain
MLSWACRHGTVSHMDENAAPWPYGQALTEAIKASGMSKREVARRAGLSSTRVKQLEDGFASGGAPASPRTINVVRLANALKMDLRKALEMAGKGDEIPEGMTDGELWAHFNHLLIDPLENASDEDFAAEFLRRMKRRMTENRE